MLASSLQALPLTKSQDSEKLESLQHVLTSHNKIIHRSHQWQIGLQSRGLADAVLARCYHLG